MFKNLLSLKSNTVYYPSFSSIEEFENHYYRAKWYIVDGQKYSSTIMNLDESVNWDEKSSTPPNHMGQKIIASKNIHVLKWKFLYIVSLFRAKNIIVWKDERKNDYFIRFKTLTRCLITRVDTKSITSIEFARYCDFAWKCLLTKKDRSKILSDNKRRFNDLYNKISTKYNRSCVFGTGPSIDKVFDYNFEDILCIVCNSTVQNTDILDHINPKFVTAGDVVSHFGISRYAEQFRSDLAKSLRDRDIFLVTTISFGYLFTQHFPELKDKVFLIPQGLGGPNHDLSIDFRLPILDSTMNIHMLPLASTFTDIVLMIGGDGKNPDVQKNEDFWAHSEKAQYHSLVDSGHICHPTFDKLRQKDTYKKYLKSISASINSGEENHSKSYYSLAPSYIEDIGKRKVSFTDKSVKLSTVTLRCEC